MRILYPHPSLGKLARREPSELAEGAARRLARYELVRRVHKLGHPLVVATAVAGCPRSTFYRYQARIGEGGPAALEPHSSRPLRLRGPLKRSPELRRQVEAIRRQNPTWGRARIALRLREEGVDVSESTVGRVIKSLVEQGAVLPVATVVARRPRRRFRPKRPHARRHPDPRPPEKPGEIIQVDHMTVAIAPGHRVKQFTAIDPVSRLAVLEVFERATAAAATLFLERILHQLPFPVQAIQVDGGSEFMAEFELACQKRGIHLYVLPPRSPKLNAHVERLNGTCRAELYTQPDLPHAILPLRPFVHRFQSQYNHDRPHSALQGRSPVKALTQSQPHLAPRIPPRLSQTC